MGNEYLVDAVSYFIISNYVRVTYAPGGRGSGRVGGMVRQAVIQHGGLSKVTGAGGPNRGGGPYMFDVYEPSRI